MNQSEGITLDFKLTINDSLKIAKTLTAFANTSGGTIAIGINDQKKILGIDPAEELYMIEKAALECCIPPIEFKSEIFEVNYIDEEKIDPEVYVLLIHVNKSNVTHGVLNKEGKLIKYHRVHDKSIPAIS
ncbi:ATP-binding protein [Belliella kenyensis]|nr:ATP-binding protein [Belliella kenyensis]